MAVGYYLYPPFFKCCPIPPSPLFFLPCFYDWMCHHATSNILFLNYIMDLFSLVTLVLAAPDCVFYATRHQIYWRFDTDYMVFASTLIWHNTHRTYRVTRLTNMYKSILTPPVMCTQQLLELHLYYAEWITCWYKILLYRGPQCFCFSKIALFQKSYICSLDSKRLSPSSETSK